MTQLRPDVLVEFGSGSIQKVNVLLDALRSLRQDVRYIPVDVCEPVLKSAAKDLLSLFPEMTVFPVVSDFTIDCKIPPVEGRKLIIFLGSTIGILTRPQHALFSGGSPR
jgi:L-histidine Nalpha-methyltransferase